MDIENYLQTGKTVKKDGTVEQTWEYKYAVEWMSDANFHFKWIIQSDDETKTSKPISTSYFDDTAYDDDDYQYANVQNVDWHTHNLDVDWSADVKWYSDMWEEKGDWFR